MPVARPSPAARRTARPRAAASAHGEPLVRHHDRAGQVRAATAPRTRCPCSWPSSTGRRTGREQRAAASDEHGTRRTRRRRPRAPTASARGRPGRRAPRARAAGGKPAATIADAADQQRSLLPAHPHRARTRRDPRAVSGRRAAASAAERHRPGPRRPERRRRRPSAPRPRSECPAYVVSRPGPCATASAPDAEAATASPRATQADGSPPRGREALRVSASRSLWARGLARIPC